MLRARDHAGDRAQESDPRASVGEGTSGRWRHDVRRDDESPRSPRPAREAPRLRPSNHRKKAELHRALAEGVPRLRRHRLSIAQRTDRQPVVGVRQALSLSLGNLRGWPTPSAVVAGVRQALSLSLGQPKRLPYTLRDRSRCTTSSQLVAGQPERSPYTLRDRCTTSSQLVAGQPERLPYTLCRLGNLRGCPTPTRS